MTRSLTMCFFLPGLGIILAQEARVSTTEIPGLIADGQLSDPAPVPEPIDFVVTGTLTKKMYVEEVSELAELPPVKGLINTTVQLVEDPGLPDPPEPLPLLPANDPAVQVRVAEARDRHKEVQIVFVSARILNYDKTILEVYPNGKAEEPLVVLSSIDYNDFSGFDTFNVAGKGADGADEVRRYALVLAIHNETTADMAHFDAEVGRTYGFPSLPDFPVDETSSFVLMEGSDEAALQAVEDMHTLYSVEGHRMNFCRIAREQVRAERKAFLLANPPKPQDVTIRFWNRSQAIEGYRE